MSEREETPDEEAATPADPISDAGMNALRDRLGELQNQVDLLGSTYGSRGELRDLVRAVTVTGLRPIVHSIRPLDQARDALALMEKGEQVGKLVLRVT